MKNLTFKTASYILILAGLTIGADLNACPDGGAHPCAEYGCNAACLADPNNYDPFDVPFDGGASLVALGGVALGALGLKKKKIS